MKIGKASISHSKPQENRILKPSLTWRWKNYIEMRDAVRDPKFHLCKKIEWLLEARHPQRFISRYAMVMFHRIPYVIAQARGAIQSAILRQLSASIDRIEDVDLQLADKLIVEKLMPLSKEESLL